MPRGHTPYGALAAALIVLGITAPWRSPQAHSPPPMAGHQSAVASSPPLLEIAPDFTRADLAGRPVRLSGYRGNVVLLSFWATWCEPCRAEAPRFSAWQRTYGPRGLQVLGISMDDDAVAAADFARELKLDYPIVMGDAQLGELFGGVLGLPLAYLIDPSAASRT
jgi:thiol-disulfide isomerase/thioredoxin